MRPTRTARKSSFSDAWFGGREDDLTVLGQEANEPVNRQHPLDMALAETRPEGNP